MSQLPAHPDLDQLRRQAREFVTAEADELIAGQYSDRPQLRPILDAVLAALPALGPLTVQARSKEHPTLVIPGNPWLAAEPVPGDSPSARWEVPVTVRRDADGFDFSGPFARGDRSDRHLGLAWGDVPGDGTLRLVRGSKLRLAGIDSRLIEKAIRPGHRLVARIRLTGARENAVRARVHPTALIWSAEPAG